MAPNRGPSKPTNKTSAGGAKKKSSSSAPSSSNRISKSKPSSSKSGGGAKRPPPKEVKSKARTAPEQQKKKKVREYTEAELGLPRLNMITPVSVQKPKGKKKGKVFVDDTESMMTILAMVNAEKEGQIESKMIKARQMEEIREAKRNEADVRQESKKAKLEETKESLKRKRKPKGKGKDADRESSPPPSSAQKPRRSKRVSFA